MFEVPLSVLDNAASQARGGNWRVGSGSSVPSWSLRDLTLWLHHECQSPAAQNRSFESSCPPPRRNRWVPRVYLLKVYMLDTFPVADRYRVELQAVQVDTRSAPNSLFKTCGCVMVSMIFEYIFPVTLVQNDWKWRITNNLSHKVLGGLENIIV